MHVLGHHCVAHQIEVILFFSNFTEDADEYVSCSRTTPQRQPSIATEGDEMQMAESVDALQALGHDEKAPRSETERCGTLNTYSCAT